MNQTIMKGHVRKINKSVIGILILLVVLSIVTGIYYKASFVLVSAIIDAVVAALAILSIYKKKYEILTSYIISFALSLMIIGNVSDSQSIYLILIPLSISALYLDMRLFSLCSIFTNIALIGKFASLSQLAVDSFVQIILVDVIVLILLFLTKNGKSLIESASKEGQKASQSFQELNKTMEVIDENTITFGKDISSCYNNLKNCKSE